MLRVGIGGALLLFTWHQIDVRHLVIVLQQAQIVPILAAISLIFPTLWLKAWRWQVLLRGFSIAINIRESYKLYCRATALAIFTPGQLGDVVKAWYLHRTGANGRQAFLSVILDRACDIAILLMLVCLSFIGYIGSSVHLTLFIGCCVLALTCTCVALTIASTRQRILSFLFRRARSRVFSEGSALLYASPAVFLPLVRKVPAALCLTGSTAALAVLRLWLVAFALGIQLPIFAAVRVNSLTTAASLLPISISGIGTRDVVVVSLLNSYNYNADKALGLSTLLLGLQIANVLPYLLHRLITMIASCSPLCLSRKEQKF